MKRVLILATFICVCSVLSVGVDARWTTRPKYTTTPSTPTTTTTETTTTTTTAKPTTTKRATTKWPATSNWSTVQSTLPPSTSNWPTVQQTVTTVPKPETDGDRYYPGFYHPAEGKFPRLVEQYDQRHLDGHYEYRYVLSNGDTRYERSYWQRVGNHKVLLRKGFYSFPLPNQNFLTVFYTADENGFHQDMSTYSPERPVLPRSLVVPESDPPTIEEILENNKQKPNKLHHSWNQFNKPTTVGTKLKTDANDGNSNVVGAGAASSLPAGTQQTHDDAVVVHSQQAIPTTEELRKIMAQLDTQILTAAEETTTTTAKNEQPQDATETVDRVEVEM